MQTRITEAYLSTTEGKLADQILRSCVHCGFCTATCPTYQLLGDELDGPRGRIYQIKQVLEGVEPTTRVQQHLDRCLTCRSCETTCPSGVRYARLLEIGRKVVEEKVGRSLAVSIKRAALRAVIPYPARFRALLKTGQLFKFMLPASLKKQLPEIENKYQWDSSHQQKKLLVLEGCVQSVTTPDTNAMASQVFAKLGYQLIREQLAGCCGAVSTHLMAEDEGLEFMRRNIDAWWPHVEKGIEGILATASGCGLMLQDYAEALAHDPEYAAKAQKISSLVKDPAQILVNADLSALNVNTAVGKVAFHAPCTLQHGLQQQGVVEKILSDLGFTLVPVKDSHLCCGSAGTYSIMQPELSERLLHNKLSALNAGEPNLIVTANIGCQMHLQKGGDKPVRHWLSLLV